MSVTRWLRGKIPTAAEFDAFFAAVSAAVATGSITRDQFAPGLKFPPNYILEDYCYDVQTINVDRIANYNLETPLGDQTGASSTTAYSGEQLASTTGKLRIPIRQDGYAIYAEALVLSTGASAIGDYEFYLIKKDGTEVDITASLTGVIDVTVQDGEFLEVRSSVASVGRVVGIHWKWRMEA